MNLEIRAAIAGNGLRAWQVAREMGLHEAAFSRLLREELSKKKRQEIFDAIDRLKRGGSNHD